MEFNATFFVSIISFLVFVYLMNKILYSPLTKVVKEREQILENNYNDAKKFNDDADVILKNRDSRLTDAENKSRKIFTDKIEDTNAKSKTLTSDASAKSADEIKSRKEELLKEKEAVRPELDSKVLGLAESISSKVLGFDVKIGDMTKLDGIKL